MLPSARLLLDGISDYAGLFPPAALAMSEAFDRYVEHRQGPRSFMVSRFVCPASRLGELGDMDPDCEAFGVLTSLDVISGEFGYLACVRAEADLETLPEGMISLDVPGGKFCRLTFPFGYLGQIYDYACSVWLPGSSWSHGDSYDFEYYPEEFDPGDDTSLMSLYVTIK